MVKMRHRQYKSSRFIFGRQIILMAMNKEKASGIIVFGGVISVLG